MAAAPQGLLLWYLVRVRVRVGVRGRVSVRDRVSVS